MHRDAAIRVIRRRILDFGFDIFLISLRQHGLKPVLRLLPGRPARGKLTLPACNNYPVAPQGASLRSRLVTNSGLTAKSLRIYATIL